MIQNLDIAMLVDYRRMRQSHVRLYQLMTWLFTPVYQRDWLAAAISRIWPAPQFLAGMVSGAIGSPLGKLGSKP